MALIIVFATPITAMLGASHNTADLLRKARGYLIGIAIGLPAMNLHRILNSYMPIDNDRDRPIIANIVLTVVDIVLDLLVVWALHGDTFELGLATSLSHYAALGVMLLHFRRKDTLLRLSLRGLSGKEALRILRFGLPNAVCRISNTLRGMFLNGMLSMVAASAAVAAYFLSAAALLPSLGADAIWAAFPVTQVVMLLTFTIMVAIHGRGSKGFLNRVTLLPPSFDVPDEDYMEKSITSLEEVCTLSQAVWDFCEQHGCDARRRHLLSLSVEEMAGNVVQHGFIDGKRHTVDVRILKKEDSYILRIRDDCLIFDPLQQVRLFSEENRTSHFGLSMIISLAKEVSHTCVLKLNNLVIKI